MRPIKRRRRLGQEVGGLSPVDLEAVVRVTWEPVRGYAWIRYLEHIEVVDNQTLARWEAALRAQLDPILVGRGDKFPCVISIDNMSVRPVVADDYGEMAKRLVANYASRHARYGRPSTVRTIVAVEALKNGVPANLFESLEDAVVYVLGEN